MDPDLESNKEKTAQVKNAEQDALERGTHFEYMTKTKGWELIQAYIQNSIVNFSNTSIVKGFDNMEQFQFERGKIAGLRNLLSQIESSISVLEHDRSVK